MTRLKIVLDLPLDEELSKETGEYIISWVHSWPGGHVVRWVVHRMVRRVVRRPVRVRMGRATRVGCTIIWEHLGRGVARVTEGQHTRRVMRVRVRVVRQGRRNGRRRRARGRGVVLGHNGGGRVISSKLELRGSVPVLLDVLSSVQAPML
ncbi:hypothetical protein PoB_001718200 [Plakobranchus ocellatus]|uniref:Uncharacterized protein n=1 Tax=Plakobranchus ocellatus TaxID=259542 RepID=A0AAV3Z5Y2_9GAST|nr:hypothetical protein PoB_001718200 [Plakobranchus ocellatus]